MLCGISPLLSMEISFSQKQNEKSMKFYKIIAESADLQICRMCLNGPGKASVDPNQSGGS